MTFGVRASHTLQSSSSGALDTSSSLWSLCYQNCTHKFPETPGRAGPPLAAPLLETQVVRDGLAKMVMVLKVGAECEEGASGAEIWERVIQQWKQLVQRLCGTQELVCPPERRLTWLKRSKGGSSQRGEVQEMGKAGSSKILSAAISRVFDFYSKDDRKPLRNFERESETT